MPSLSLNVGLNNGRKLPFGGAAPSGIPVATTNTIIVTDTNTEWDGPYLKESSTAYRNENDYYELFTWNGTQWRFYSEDTFGERFASPPSNDINYIATTGWSNGYSTITITAA